MTLGLRSSTIAKVDVELRFIGGSRSGLVLPLPECVLRVASTSTLGAAFIAAKYGLDAPVVHLLARSVEKVAARLSQTSA